MQLVAKRILTYPICKLLYSLATKDKRLKVRHIYQRHTLHTTIKPKKFLPNNAMKNKVLYTVQKKMHKTKQQAKCFQDQNSSDTPSEDPIIVR